MFMKKIIFAVAVFTTFILSSCTTAYNTRVLQGNYDIRMDNAEELEMKGKVRIFTSESDVKGDYDIISYNVYKPFTIPIIAGYKGQTLKKFYEKAVKYAYNQGGNGIIITAAGMYKVICIHNWDSDNAQSGKFVNSILDTTLLDIFASNKIANMANREVKRYKTDLINEINFNLKTVKTSEEINVIGKKLTALENWNNNSQKPEKKLTKQLTVYRKLYTALSKRIAKKEAKKNKKN